MLTSSSLSLKDFGDVDRGVLGVAECGCGLNRMGVSGWLMLIEDVAELLRTPFLCGESVFNLEGGETTEARCDGDLSDERMRWPVANIVG